MDLDEELLIAEIMNYLIEDSSYIKEQLRGIQLFLEDYASAAIIKDIADKLNLPLRIWED